MSSLANSSLAYLSPLGKKVASDLLENFVMSTAEAIVQFECFQLSFGNFCDDVGNCDGPLCVVSLRPSYKLRKA